MGVKWIQQIYPPKLWQFMVLTPLILCHTPDHPNKSHLRLTVHNVFLLTKDSEGLKMLRLSQPNVDCRLPLHASPHFTRRATHLYHAAGQGGCCLLGRTAGIGVAPAWVHPAVRPRSPASFGIVLNSSEKIEHIFSPTS